MVVVVVYGGGESDWGEDVRSWKKENLWRGEGGEGGIFWGWVVEGALGVGDGELVGWFLIWGFGGDCCGVYGLVVLLAEGRGGGLRHV